MLVVAIALAAFVVPLGTSAVAAAGAANTVGEQDATAYQMTPGHTGCLDRPGRPGLVQSLVGAGAGQFLVCPDRRRASLRPHRRRRHLHAHRLRRQHRGCELVEERQCSRCRDRLCLRTRLRAEQPRRGQFRVGLRRRYGCPGLVDGGPQSDLYVCSDGGRRECLCRRRLDRWRPLRLQPIRRCYRVGRVLGQRLFELTGGKRERGPDVVQL